MRFRFCWDVDCPDWLLAEIATLSKLSSVKLRLLSAAVAKSIHGDPLSYDVVTKLSSDAKLSEDGSQASVAAVRWVLCSAAGAAVTPAVLDSELQQLGLPKEHAAAISRVYGDHLPRLTHHLQHTSLKVGGEVQWTCRVAGVGVGGGVEPVVELGMEQAGGTTKLALTPTQLHALVHELSEARRLMEALH
ncbi:COMM domain-containing protein 4-like [Eriocheir sinensis]|uniref:COMM domain-containing protein 4-like n=1 Tax=Eriocheir sinensis TaxID=95602 RepID=UPI0021C88D09|nr:COMM domain-containing protein 4-like [Eriocheir sinensis]